MFTGIIKEVGVAVAIEKAGAAYRLTVESGLISKEVSIGDSISVNGVCLTLVGNKSGIMHFDIMEETLRRSCLKELRHGQRVNLESALRADGVLGGHFVSGHVDCVGKIRDMRKTGGEVSFEIEIPGGLNDLIIEKGSIAIDGVSLTVGEAGNDNFKVYLIPHTLGTTTLGEKKTGDKLNIEFDIIGKYVAKLNAAGRRPAITKEFLKEKGF